MNVFSHISLLHYNTFKIAVSAAQLIEIEDVTELSALHEQGVFNQKFLVIGGGSNLLFLNDFDGTILKPCFKGIRKVRENADAVWLAVAAGEVWDDFVNFAIENNYYGVENLMGIPGLVGSSPVQNIGAYGVEVKSVIESVNGFIINELQPFSYSNAQCQFAYRDSIFKHALRGKCIITEVVFRLSKKPQFQLQYAALSDFFKADNQPLTLKSVSEAVIKIRNSKLPDIRFIGCAGSFFKNPIISQKQLAELLQKFPQLTHYQVDSETEKLAAAQLIDMCGLKGFRQGDVAVYEKQPLVLVNYGGASGQEVADFCKNVVQKQVAAKFGITLSPEVNFIQ